MYFILSLVLEQLMSIFFALINNLIHVHTPQAAVLTF